MEYVSADEFQLLKIVPGSGGNGLVRVGRSESKEYAIKFLLWAEKQQNTIFK